jgi:hypothetical protein
VPLLLTEGESGFCPQASNARSICLAGQADHGIAGDAGTSPTTASGSNSTLRITLLSEHHLQDPPNAVIINPAKRLRLRAVGQAPELGDGPLSGGWRLLEGGALPHPGPAPDTLSLPPSWLAPGREYTLRFKPADEMAGVVGLGAAQVRSKRPRKQERTIGAATATIIVRKMVLTH